MTQGRAGTRLMLGAGLAMALAVSAWLLRDGSGGESAHGPVATAGGAGDSTARPALPEIVALRASDLAPSAPEAPAVSPAPHLRDDVGVAIAFSGRVVDADAAPLADADVWLVPSGPTLRAMGFAPEPWSQDTFSPDIANGGRLDAVPLAQVPHVRTGADGRFTLTGRDVPLADRNPDTSDGAPFPVLVVVHVGFTSLTWRATKWSGNSCDAGDLAIEPEVAVTGRAVDDAGQPLESVTVQRGYNLADPSRLKWADAALFVPELSSMRTGADGRFALHGLWPGDVGLELRAPDRVLVQIDRRKIAQAGALDLGDVTVPRGGAIDGVVVDESGAPVPGAEVLAADREIHGGFHADVGYGYDEGDDTIEDELMQVRGDFRRSGVTSDARGAFHLGGLDAMNYTLYGAARGFEPQRLHDVGAGARAARLVLRPEAVLVVEVRDAATGDLLAGAQLAATRLAEDPAKKPSAGELVVPLEVVAGRDAAALRSGEDFPPGRFLVRGVGTVGTQLVATAEGRAVTVLVTPGVPVAQRANCTVRVASEGVLAGHVRDAHGAPVARAAILACEPGARGLARPLAVTDDAGGWELRGLPAGSMNLFVRADGQAESDELPLDVVTGQSRRDVDFVLPAAAVLRGHVLRPDGTPFGGARVDLDVPPFGEFKWKEISRSFERSKLVDPDGGFEFGHLRPGAYELSVKGAGKQDVELKAGDEHDVDFRVGAPSRLRGRVMLGGAPVPDAQVEVSRISSPDGDSRGWINPGQTNTQGEYEVTLLGAGTYRCSVKGKGLAKTAAGQFTVEAGGVAVRDVDLPAGSIAGRVVRDTDEQGVAKIEVTLFRDDDAVIGWATTDDGGRFRLRGVAAGSLRLGVGRWARSEHPREAPLCPLDFPLTLATGESREDVELHVCPGGTLTGRVTLPTGVSAKDGAPVLLVRVENGAIATWPSFVYGSSADDDDDFMYREDGPESLRREGVSGGTYRFLTVPAGEYRVLAQPDFESGTDAAKVLALGASITVPEHGAAALDLIAQP